MENRPTLGQYTLFLMVFILSGCAQVTKMTPETLVLSKLLDSPQNVRPSSVLFLREQSLMEHYFVLAQYTVNKTNGEISNCHALFDTFLDQQNMWVTSGGDPSCSPQSTTKIGTSWTSYGTGSLAKPSGIVYSYIYGRVSNDDIVSIIITWDDRLQQTVGLNQNTYLAVRIDKSSRIEVVGKDKLGKIIYTDSFTPVE